MALFLTMFAEEVNELRKSITQLLQQQTRTHQGDVISYLLQVRILLHVYCYMHVITYYCACIYTPKKRCYFISITYKDHKRPFDKFKNNENNKDNNYCCYCHIFYI